MVTRSRGPKNATRGPPAAPEAKETAVPAAKQLSRGTSPKKPLAKGGHRPARAKNGKKAPTAESVARTVVDSPVSVVGIGASAGGLDALSEFFRHVPAVTGLAYMVVQHLSPNHGSILAELLAKQAAIPVTEAADGERLAPNHAYVIAPDTKMTLTDGHLKLVPRDPASRPPLPVDALFRSLAEVQESRTIGVVLSGTGSDGALGVRAIRGVGGITFAQDPASAASPGMPLAAIATSCVDVTATAAAIATRIASLSEQTYLRPSALQAAERLSNAPGDGNRAAADGDGAPSADSMQPDRAALADICNQLRRSCGVDFELYKIGTVERRIRRRITLRNVDSMGAYAESLRGDGAELEALCSELLIGVTRFFRDLRVFDALSNVVLPELLKERAAARGDDISIDPSPLRVWIAGCSTGEEAYSFAICLLELVEAYAPRTTIQIFATDLSAAAISIARAAKYPAGIEADVSADRLNRFFVKDEGGYRVDQLVRDCCVFAVQNLTADPPFSRLDIVSCRNVLIYLKPDAHTRLLSVFHYSLKPTGILVLGTSESITAVSGLFTSLDKANRIYGRATGPARSRYLDIAAAQPVSSGDGTRNAVAANRPSGTGKALATATSAAPAVVEVQREADRVILSRYAPAAVLVDADYHILQFRGRTGSFIEPQSGAASFHLLKMVRPELVAPLSRAIDKARADASPVRVENIGLGDDHNDIRVNLSVLPFRVSGSTTQFFIVSFEDGVLPNDAVRGAGAKGRKGHASVRRSSAGRTADARELGELRQELDAAQRRLQTIVEEHASVIEEFQAASEEVQSTNEELQSTNEEIETSKEELQSLNEELTTLNDELRTRNADADRLNDDLTNLLSAMHVPVTMVGLDHRLRRYTTGAERLANLIPADIGRRISDIKSSVDLSDMDQLITDVIQSARAIEREVTDSTGHWYLMTIRPYRTANGEIDGAVIIYHDIDVRKRAADQLATANVELAERAGELQVTTDELRGKTAEAQASNQVKAEFLATMSHELRTPLNAIAGYAQLIDMGIRGPVTDAQHIDLQRIARSQQHLMGLINEILNFAKLDAGTVAIARSEVNLHEMLIGVADMLTTQMTRKGITFEVQQLRLDDPTFVVLGDEDKIRQILLNLLTNSFKFTAAGGRVDFICDADDQVVRLLVKDTGIGITPGELLTIFEPFVQINPLLTKATDGIGLGLAISRALARAMDGDVTAESEIGKGSTFTLTLPRARPETPAPVS